VEISIRKANEKNADLATIVVFVKKTKKMVEAAGAGLAISDGIDAAFADGVEFSDLKKGLMLRNLAEGPYRNALVFSMPEKISSSEDIRALGGTVVQAMKANKVAHADVPIEAVVKGEKDVAAATSAFVEGLCLANYVFDMYKSKPDAETAKSKQGAAGDSDKKENKPPFKIQAVKFILNKSGGSAKIETGIENGQKLIESVNVARTFANMPGNDLYPESLVEEMQKAAKGTGLKVTAWNKERLEKERMGGLLNVGKGSANDPRFIVLEYNGAAKSKAPVCFVGKAITFDTGGISLKPGGGMEEMKYDMCGGANVFGTLLAIAKLKLKINVVGLIASAENMPGSKAMRPGDIIKARNGKTVEVDNTDAEGRLVLMDALVYASELKPVAIMDAATLTGAMVVALGNSYTGVFTPNDKLMKDVAACSAVAGEKVWRMPVDETHASDMKGVYADLNNMSSFKGAGSSTAAAFLRQFVDKDIPWAHFDIAGTAYHVSNRISYLAGKGASGVMIRTFVELAKTLGK
jgi:leucyl aminopeptidase